MTKVCLLLFQNSRKETLVNLEPEGLHIVNLDNFDEIEYFKEDNRIVLKRVGLFSDSTEALTLQGEKANRLKRILDSEIENESIRE